MTIIIDEKKIVKGAKSLAILLVVAFAVVFLALSVKIFHFSENNPRQYQINYSRLSAPGKGVASSMRKTGEIQSQILTKNLARTQKSNGFFDEVEKIHKSR